LAAFAILIFLGVTNQKELHFSAFSRSIVRLLPDWRGFPAQARERPVFPAFCAQKKADRPAKPEARGFAEAFLHKNR
jgi:hypothetical protein